MKSFLPPPPLPADTESNNFISAQEYVVCVQIIFCCTYDVQTLPYNRVSSYYSIKFQKVRFALFLQVFFKLYYTYIGTQIFSFPEHNYNYNLHHILDN